MASANMNRVPFCSQKYIYIILHYNKSDPIGLKIIFEGLREILTVAAGVSGASRIPGIGIGILATPFQQILPTAHVKGCLDSILLKLEKLMNVLPSDPGDDIIELLVNNLPYVIKDVSDFTNNENKKLKLLVFTWDVAEVLMTGIASYVNDCQSLCLSSVKVYQVHELYGADISMEVKRVPDPIETEVGLQVMGDFLQLDPFSVRIIFKEWLVESTGKNAHVVLKFMADDTKKAIYVDVQECAIDPLSLPSAVYSRLSLPLNNNRTTTTTSGHMVSIIELEAVRRINVASLSANLQYGSPLYLVPSAAEVLSFEDYWENSQRIYSLCQRLETNDEALLCHRLSSSGPSNPVSLLSHYIIVAFNKALSLIQLTPPELTLVECFTPSYCEPPEKYQEQIDDVLNGLEKSDFQIDHLVDNNLVPALISHLSRTQRGTCRPMTTIPSYVPPSAVRPTTVRRGTGAARRGASRRGNENVHPCYQDPRRGPTSGGW